MPPLLLRRAPACGGPPRGPHISSSTSLRGSSRTRSRLPCSATRAPTSSATIESTALTWCWREHGDRSPAAAAMPRKPWPPRRARRDRRARARNRDRRRLPAPRAPACRGRLGVCCAGGAGGRRARRAVAVVLRSRADVGSARAQRVVLGQASPAARSGGRRDLAALGLAAARRSLGHRACRRARTAGLYCSASRLVSRPPVALGPLISSQRTRRPDAATPA
jgi:hypothetical protein